MRTFKQILLGALVAASIVACPIYLNATVTNLNTQTKTAMGNGVTVNYTIGFDFRDNTEVQVIRQDNSVTPPSQTTIAQGAGASKFTITGGNPGTTVHMGTAPTSTQFLYINRVIPLTQTVVYDDAAAFPAADTEAQMDRMVMALQQLDAEIKAPFGDLPDNTVPYVESGLAVGDGTNFNYNPSTTTLACPYFSGALHGNADTATLASTVTTAATTTNSDLYMLMAPAASGSQSPKTVSGFTWNRATNLLTTDINGNVTGQSGSSVLAQITPNSDNANYYPMLATSTSGTLPLLAPSLITMNPSTGIINADLNGTAGLATQITTTASTTNVDNYLLFAPATSGSQGALAASGIKVNPSTSTITATTFNGTVTNATNATNATNVATTASTTNVDNYLLFATNTSGNQGALTASGVKVNPSTAVITATLNGAATSATTATNATNIATTTSTTNVDNYLLFAPSTSGNQGALAASGVKVNPNTSTITASLTGTASGNIPNSIGTTAGDIIVFTGSATPVRKAKCSTGYFLASSTAADGWTCTAPAGGGTVTSVTYTGDGVLHSSTPTAAVTTSGTLTATLNTQTANTVLSGPSSGGAVAPTFRALVSADLPAGPTTPIGGIIMYGASSAPTNYVLCDGASLAQSGTYAALYAVIGTTFGSADGSHFNVPDMRGVFPKGAGTTNRSAGKDANGNFYAATLGTYYTDKMQGHKHGPASPSTLFFGDNGATAVLGSGGGVNFFSATTTPITDGTNGTPRTGLTTEPQSLGITYIIRYQ